MSKTRVFTKMVSGDSPRMPAIRIAFKGKYQVDYFSLNKIAAEDFETAGTTLGRQVIHEWILNYRRKKEEGKPTGAEQMSMILRADRESAFKRKAKKER